MNQSKRWIWSASRASLLGGAVAAILLGGCSLLFESGSTSEDGGLRDDSGLRIDSGTTGDGGPGGADSGQTVDAQVIDSGVAVNVDAAGDQLVTFTVQCPSLVNGVQCKCELTTANNGTTSTSSGSDDAVCTRMVANGTPVTFDAIVTRPGNSAPLQCELFGWSPSSIDGAPSCSPSLSTCTATISSGVTVSANCQDNMFFGTDQ